MFVRRFPFLIHALLMIAIIVSSSVTGTVSADAQEPIDGFTVKAEPDADPATTAQGYFIFQTDPGSNESGTLRFTNPTADTIGVDLTAVDAITANNGGSAFATEDAELAAVGTWLQIDDPVVTLEPGEDQLIEFTVKVPKKVKPGQYLAGLAAAVAQPTDDQSTPVAPAENQAGASIDLRTRYVIGVEIDVAGEWTPSLVIQDVTVIDQPSGPVIGIALHNDGATFLHPAGTLELTGADGKIALEHTIEMGTFVTGTVATYPVSLNRVLTPGAYQVRVDLEYGDDQTVSYEDTIDIGNLSVQAVTFSSLSIEEVRSAPDGTLQFVTIAVALENPGSPVANARLTLHVSRDGAPVEDVVLSEAMALRPGAGQISQRYLPPTGWESGTYAFSVTIEDVNPETGTAVELASAQSETTVTVH
jgi:hypothetical protein